MNFVCPSCRQELTGAGLDFVCEAESLHFSTHQDIPDFILPSRRDQVDRFLDLYRLVRKSEGWGSNDADYYLSLPYRDTSGKHAAIWKIRSKTFDTFMAHRAQEDNGAKTILDLGAGNCWLSRRLAEEEFDVTAVDIHIDESDGLRVPQRIRKNRSVEFNCIRAEFDHLPFPERWFDIIIFNASLHFARDPYLTLLNTGRLLKEGGSMYVLDSPIYRDERSGRGMIDERRNDLGRRFDIEIPEEFSGSFLLYDRIKQLDDKFAIQLISPKYGLKWNARRLLPFLLNRREPASFEIVHLKTKPNSA